MIRQGSIISHAKMCDTEGVSLQRGMNFRSNRNLSIILMSARKNAPYVDRVFDQGKVLVYEGHDISNSKGGHSPKNSDQQLITNTGKLTQNGKFFNAAQEYKDGKIEAEIVKVYEKIRAGIWVYNGLFRLLDAWKEFDGNRNVFKFRLEIMEKENSSVKANTRDMEHNRLIPSEIKLAVWERDKGKCVLCGSGDNLHFDHIIPFSKGGSSLVEDNIQLLCARHNLSKHDKIE